MLNQLIRIGEDISLLLPPKLCPLTFVHLLVIILKIS